MDERMRFVARVLEGEKMAVLCREFDISRNTGYKLFNRYKNCGIEGLTDRIEAEALDYIRRIDEMGGTLAAIEAGFIQGEIQRSAYEFQREVESGKRVIVGVNRFQTEEAVSVPVFRVDPAIERARVEEVRALRTARNAEGWRRALEALEFAARNTDNLMPLILGAAEADATVGEISDTLRRVFGEYRDNL